MKEPRIVAVPHDGRPDPVCPVCRIPWAEHPTRKEIEARQKPTRRIRTQIVNRGPSSEEKA